MASQATQQPLPYYEELNQYFLSLSNFLNITTAENPDANKNDTKDRSKSVRAQKARAKLLKLSPLQFYELCTDVTDELNRRIRETGTKNENSNSNTTTTNNGNNNLDDKSKDYLLPKSNYHVKRNQARQKLSNLSQLRFNDLIDDILFEMRRRGYPNVGFDNENILNSKMSSPEIINSEEVETNKLEIQENDEKSTFNNNEHTIDSNITVPLPSVIQSSLIIPRKASIDWSDEEEEEEDQQREQEREQEEDKSKANGAESIMINISKEEVYTGEMKLEPEHSRKRELHVASDDELENGNITEDLIRHNPMENPFNYSTKNTTSTVSENDVIEIPSLKSKDPLTAPSYKRNTTNNGDITGDKTELSISTRQVYDTNGDVSIKSREQTQSSNNIPESTQLNDNVTATNRTNSDDNQSPNEKDKESVVTGPLLAQESYEDSSVQSSNQSSNIFSSSIEHPTAPSVLQTRSSNSYLQNELILLNKQLTSLSIENEKLKTKISELEMMNNSQQNVKNNANTFNSSKSLDHTNIGKNDYVLSSLKHENIAQFIKEYGVIPETLILQLYDVVNELYTHIDNTRKSSMNLTNVTSEVSFGRRLFQLINQLYSILLKVINLLSQSEEKDKIVLLKSTFSNLITTSKYFALYHHILPDIVIISSINECIFIIMDIVNILKVKGDIVTVSEGSFKGTNIPIFKTNRDLSGIPLSTPADLITSNNSSEINSIENSPVKPLRIIEKVASSPLITGISSNDSKSIPSTVRKPSNNMLLSLTTMVKKSSNEKLVVNKDRKSTQNSEIVSDISSNVLHKRSSQNLIKKMAFASPSASSSSDGEKDDDDDDDAENLLYELRKQREDADLQLQEASSPNEDGNIRSSKPSNKTWNLSLENSKPNIVFDDKDNLKVTLPEQKLTENGPLKEELLHQELADKHELQLNSSDQESVKKAELEEKSSQQYIPSKSISNVEPPDQKSVEEGHSGEGLLEQVVLDKHELKKEESSEKELNIPKATVFSEGNANLDIGTGIKSGEQVSQLNSKANSQPNPNSTHSNDSTSDAASYATTNNELPSEINIHPTGYVSAVDVVPSSSLKDNIVEYTGIQEITDPVGGNNNFGNLSAQNENEKFSTDIGVSSTQMEDGKFNNDNTISQSNERSDKIDEPNITERQTCLASKVNNSSVPLNLNANTSLKSADLPTIKPFKIMKLESRSLKKINLPSKDTKNENTPGLGITLGESSGDITKFSDTSKVGRNLEFSGNKEMALQTNDEQYSGNKHISDNLSSNTATMDKKKKEIVINEIPENRQVNQFDAFDDKSSDMELQDNDKVKIPDSYTTDEENLNEIYSRQSSVTIHPLESLKQQVLEKTNVVEGDNIQYNDNDVDSYILHDSLDLNQTKDERELSNFEETPTTPEFEQNGKVHKDTSKQTAIENTTHHISERSIKNGKKFDSDFTMDDDDDFQFIPLQNKNSSDMQKNANVQDSLVSEIGGPTLINQGNEMTMINKIVEDTVSNSESDSEEEDSTEGSNSESESESESATVSDSASDFESGSDSTEEVDYDDEEEEGEEGDVDFDVEAFDIENPDNTLSELLLYLEHQTVQVITTIQSLLTSIKQPKSTKGNLRKESNAINQVIKQMVSATSISMNQSRNANLKEHGSWVVQSLEDCSRRMITLCQLNPGGEIKVMDNDTDYADKNFKQRLAGIAFDIAKCTKELVKTVEEASLKEEIEYLNSKIHKK